jgi:hypothetical protein
MSQSLHLLATIADVGCWPSEILAHIERHGFDFTRIAPLLPLVGKPAGKSGNVGDQTGAGPKRLAPSGISVGNRGHFQVPFD